MQRISILSYVLVSLIFFSCSDFKSTYQCFKFIVYFAMLSFSIIPSKIQKCAISLLLRSLKIQFTTIINSSREQRIYVSSLSLTYFGRKRGYGGEKRGGGGVLKYTRAHETIFHKKQQFWWQFRTFAIIVQTILFALIKKTGKRTSYLSQFKILWIFLYKLSKGYFIANWKYSE